MKEGEGEVLYDAERESAWRPFERGPRACIGHGLAILEMKVLLVLVVREFEFVEGYEDGDEGRVKRSMMSMANGEEKFMNATCTKSTSSTEESKSMSNSKSKSGKESINEKGYYQFGTGMARPTKGFPVRVSLRRSLS